MASNKKSFIVKKVVINRKAIINNKNKIKETNKIADIFIYGIAAFAALITIYPFIYIFSMSISDPNEVIKNSIFLLPRGFSLEAYKFLVKNIYLWRSLFNSILYTSIGTVCNLVMALLAGYPLAKPRLVMKKIINIYLVIPMYFSGGLIPGFILITQLGLYNTFWVMIIPSMISIWNVILVRTYIKSIPYSLQESAIIDGASEFRILTSIIVPLVKPIIAVICLYTAVGIWNDYFTAMIYMPNRDLHPLQMYMARVLIFNETSLAETKKTVGQEIEVMKLGTITQLKYAVIIFTNIPIIILYPFLQKYFIKGVMIGSLKE